MARNSHVDPRVARAVHKLHREKKTYTEIGAYFDYTESWARKVVQAYSSTTGKPRKPPGPVGRPHKCGGNLDATIDQLAASNPTGTAKEFSEAIKESCGAELSSRTIQRRLKERGWRRKGPVKDAQTAKYKTQRVGWYREELREVTENPKYFSTSAEAGVPPVGKQKAQTHAKEAQNSGIARSANAAVQPPRTG